VSYLYPHLMALGMIIYNLGLALIPAIFGALWNRPRTNVMLAMRWGVLLTALLYPLWDKNTFLAALPVCAILVMWPFKAQKPSVCTVGTVCTIGKNEEKTLENRAIEQWNK
jgi:hypothetical protein